MSRFTLNKKEKLTLYSIAKKYWIDSTKSDEDKDVIVDGFLYALDNILNSQQKELVSNTVKEVINENLELLKKLED